MKNLFKILLLLIFILVFIMSCREEIINKSAFFPQSGSVVDINELPNHIEHVYIKTSDNIKISTFLLKNQNSTKAALYFHGNAGNASQRLGIANKLWELGLNVLLVDYRGYGLSDGEPSENGIYIDAQSAFDYLLDTFSFKESDITVIGRSIGTTVAIDLTQNLDVNGLILISPLSSGKDAAIKANIISANVIAGNTFNSIEKIESVIAPICIIHGNKDTILPIEMGRKLKERAKVECRFIEIDGAGHNDIIYRNEEMFYSYIKEFLNDIDN